MPVIFFTHMHKALVGMLTLLIFNFSIAYNKGVRFEVVDNTVHPIVQADPPNEIESVFELITEEWMDIEDCVPETDDDDTPEDGSKVNHVYWQLHQLPAIAFDWQLYKPLYTIAGTSSLFFHNAVPLTPPPDTALYS
jgi:hypothetical protein